MAENCAAYLFFCLFRSRKERMRSSILNPSKKCRKDGMKKRGETRSNIFLWGTVAIFYVAACGDQRRDSNHIYGCALAHIAARSGATLSSCEVIAMPEAESNRW